MLEDPHWADALSLDAFSAVMLSTGAAPARLLLVVTTRPEGLDQNRHGWADRLVRDGAMDRLVLTAMDLVDLAAVLQEELGGRPSRGLVRAIADASGGNPLLARVAAAQLERTGQIVERDDGLVSTGLVPEAVAADIHAPYASAIESLPAETRDVLSTLAVLGDQASIADLTAVTGRTPSEVIEAVVAAEDLVLFDWSTNECNSATSLCVARCWSCWAKAGVNSSMPEPLRRCRARLLIRVCHRRSRSS